MLGKQAHQSEEGKKSSPKKTGLVAALTAVLCLSCAAMYHRLTDDSNLVSDEISHFQLDPRAHGYAGFYYHSGKMTWNHAERWCLAHEMVLATVNQQWKRDKIMALTGNKQVWIGYEANGGQSKSHFSWVSGADKGYAPWAPGEPSSNSGEQCTELKSNGQFNNLPCNSINLPFVCDRSPYIQAYAMHGSIVALSWDDANGQCFIRYGTGLATLGPAELMSDIMQKTGAGNTWVGLRVPPGDDWSEANFKFISGIDRTEALNWDVNEPNNYLNSDERCVSMNSHGKLNDANCREKKTWYLCDQFVSNTAVHYSSFEINSERSPIKNNHLWGRSVFFQGRNKYKIVFKIRINALTSHLSSILHIGNSDNLRLPAIFQNGNNERKLMYRQKSSDSDIGCSAGTPVTLGQWFKAEIRSRPHNFHTYHNGFSTGCYANGATVNGGNVDQKVWFSDPWYDAAPVTVKQLRFYFY